MDVREIRGFAKPDLRKKIEAMEEELFNTKVQALNGSLENTSKIREIRRTIARAKTILNENAGK